MRRVRLFLAILLVLLLASESQAGFNARYPVTVPPSATVELPTTIAVHGKLLLTDVAPVTVNGRLLVPLRPIFEALGAEVSWNAATSTATGRRGNRTVVITVDSPMAMVDGQAMPLDVPAQVVSGRTMVPLRFIGNALGESVGWKDDVRVAYIGENPFSTYPGTQLLNWVAADPNEVNRSVYYFGQKLTSKDGKFGAPEQCDLEFIGYDEHGRAYIRMTQKTCKPWKVKVQFISLDNELLADTEVRTEPNLRHAEYFSGERFFGWTTAWVDAHIGNLWDSVEATPGNVSPSKLAQIKVAVVMGSFSDSFEWVIRKAEIDQHSTRVAIPVTRPVLAPQVIPVKRSVNMLNNQLRIDVDQLVVKENGQGYVALRATGTGSEDLKKLDVGVTVDYEGGVNTVPFRDYAWLSEKLFSGATQSGDLAIGGIADARTMKLTLRVVARGDYFFEPSTDESKEITIKLN